MAKRSSRHDELPASGGAQTVGRLNGPDDFQRANLKLAANSSLLEELSRTGGRSIRDWVQRLLRAGADLTSIAVALATGALTVFLINDVYLGRATWPLIADTAPSRLVDFFTLAVLLMAMFGSRGHYSSRNPFWTEARDVVVGVILFALVDSALQFAFKDQPSRLWLGTTWAVAIPFILLGRILLRRILRKMGKWNVRTLMIGEDQSAENASSALQSEAYLGYEVVAHTTFANFDPDDQVSAVADSYLASVGGSVGHAIAKIAADCEADFIVLAPSYDEFDKLDIVVRHLDRRRISYAVVPPLRGVSLLSLEPQHFYSHELMMLTFRASLTNPLARFLKRTFDLLVASLLSFLLLPLFLVVGAVVRWDGGRAFYRQQRVGKNGRIFDCLKFRTMDIDADGKLAELLRTNPGAVEEWERDRKLKDDPRITRIGAFLRRTSLDELPQLFNVLRGEMSLVGPRPVVTEELARYGDNLDYYLSSHPGITGLWQVSGRNNTSYQRRVELDRWYVQNWSLWQDIAILCKTIPAIAGRDGAY